MLEQSAFATYYHRFIVNPLSQILTNRVSPNTITLLGGLFGFLVLLALYLGHPVFAIGLLLLSGLCDSLDGHLARNQEQSTEFGCVLDIVIDRFVEVCVVLGLWSVAPHQRALSCLLMLSSILLCITSFLVVGIFTPNQSHKSFHYSPGLIERAEAFIFFIVMMVWPQAFNILAGLFVALVLLTSIIRLREYFQVIKQGVAGNEPPSVDH